MGTWPEQVERVAAVLRGAGVDARLEEFPEGTPTAAAAARAIGCEPEEIVKSIVFVCDGRPVLALVPGDRRADPNLVAAAVKAGYARVARPEEVMAATGFEPGAVAPFPSAAVTRVLLEKELLVHEIVWAGAGSARHMVGLSPVDLARIAHAEPADLAELDEE
jgi:prolyl-tRNA editing enzyme YbaK/EbsC (Cys-tRNA(Pro) deacylase)